MRVILVGSYFESRGELKRLWPALKSTRKDVVIGLDGGVRELARAGVRADLAVGDWDSLGAKNRLLTEIPHLTLRADKDRSDLHYGLALALMAGATEIVCLGVTGGRPDHHLASLMDLTELARVARGIHGISALDECREYRWVAQGLGPLSGKLARGTAVSVFSMAGTAEGVTLEGFTYSLKDARLEPSSHGISNEARARRQRITVRKGVLLAMIRRPASPRKR